MRGYRIVSISVIGCRIASISVARGLTDGFIVVIGLIAKIFVVEAELCETTDFVQDRDQDISKLLSRHETEF